MKTYLFFATLHSGKWVVRVIKGHAAVKAEIERVLKLNAFYSDYQVYTTV
jgi:hypothetical protein